MPSRIPALFLVLAMASAVAAPVPRITKQCRPGDLTGDVALRFTGLSRESFIAVAGNPQLDPDLYFRLWNPTKARMTSIGFEAYVIFTYDTAQDTAEIALPKSGKPYKILSRQDVTALEMMPDKNGRITGAVRIKNAEQFWAASKYLILIEQ